MELSKKLLRMALLLGGMVLCQYAIAQEDPDSQILCVINEEDSDADEDDLGGASDIDEDGDGLIEICTLEELNAIRYQLDGSGYRRGSDSQIKVTAGCPASGCIGYELTGDLDFLEDSSYRFVDNKAIWTSGEGWQSIGTTSEAFTGIFNGNGYTISNLRMDRRQSDRVALFGLARQAGIINVGLLNLEVYGRYIVGGLLGRSDRSTIINSYAIGRLVANNRIGLLVGWNDGGEIHNSYAMGEIEAVAAGGDAGGLTGMNSRDGRIVNCYTRSNVSGRDKVGGIVGVNSADITKSYATGISRVTPSVDIFQNLGGGIAGSNQGGTINMSHWNFESQFNFDSVQGTHSLDGAAVTKSLQTQVGQDSDSDSIFYTWSSDDWEFANIEHNYPQYPMLKYKTGSVAGLSVCSTTEMPRCGSMLPDQFDIDQDNDGLIELRYIEELNAMRYQLDGMGYRANSSATLVGKGCPVVNGIEKCRGYELAREMGFGGIDDNDTEIDYYYWNIENRHLWSPRERVGSGWPPIGLAGDGLDAVFEGNRYGLHDLWLDNRSAAGFFADISRNAEVNGVLFLFPRVVGGTEVGTLAASNSGSVSEIGLYFGFVEGDSLVGGLVGTNNGTIHNTFINDLDMRCGAGQWHGGLVGRNDKGAMLSYSYVHTFDRYFNRIFCSEGSRYIGGLVGGNTENSTVTHSFAQVLVTGGSSIGGLVGLNSEGSDIENSYALEDVEAISTLGASSGQVGGLVGVNTGRIANSYSIGKVSGRDAIGGLVGSTDENGSVIDSYWNTELSGLSQSAGGTGLPGEQLKKSTTATEIYTNWHHVDWDFGSDLQYPVIKSPVCVNEVDPDACMQLLGAQRLTLQALLLPPHNTLVPQLRPPRAIYDIVVPEGQREIEVTPFVDDPSRLYSMRIRNTDLDDRQTHRFRVFDEFRIDIQKSNFNFVSHRSRSVSLTFYINRMITKINYNNEELDEGGIISITEGDVLDSELEGELLLGRISTVFDRDAFEEISAGMHLSYLWSDLSGSDILSTVDTRQINLMVPQIPVAMIPENIELSDIKLRLNIRYRETSSNRTITLRVIKANNGSISLEAPFIEPDRYGIAVDLSEDPDGVSPNPRLEYQWQTRASDSEPWRDIENGTNSYYLFANAIQDNQYRVWVEYTDGQNYSQRLVSLPITYNDPNSEDIGLEKLELRADGDVVALTPSFTIESTATRYEAEVVNNIDTVALVVATRHNLTALSINGDHFLLNERTVDIGVEVGTNLIEIEARAPNGNTQTYTVAVKRRKSNNANLRDLAVIPGNLDFSRCDTDCTITVDNSINAASVTAEIADREASIAIDGVPAVLRDGVASTDVANLAVNIENIVTIVVTAADRETTKTYRLGIVRAVARSDNADLADLQISPPGNLPLMFSRDIDQYRIGVSTPTRILRVHAQASEGQGFVAINNRPLSVRAATADIMLADIEQETPITITVESPDRTTMKSYHLTVIRESDRAQRLENLELSLDYAYLQPRFEGELSDYILNAPLGIRQLQVTPTLASTESVTINILSSADSGFSINAQSGMQSDAIPLNLSAATIITIIVTTSLDRGEDSVIYRIDVRRDADGDGILDSGDIDADGDGLIEIYSLHGLNAIRHNLDGSGYMEDAEDVKNTTGCPRNGGCKGFELRSDLDFLDEADYLNQSDKTAWTTGAGWNPIGTGRQPFRAIFDGNGHTIFNLMIDRADSDYIALFGVTSASTIFNIGLLQIDINGRNNVGGLIGWNNGGVIANSFAIGRRTGNTRVGGLVGWNNGGDIINSYVMGEVRGVGENYRVGGLTGLNDDGATISDVYVRANVFGRRQIGGVIGANRAELNKCYFTGLSLVEPYTDFYNHVGKMLIGSNHDGISGNCHWNVEPQFILDSFNGSPRFVKELQTSQSNGGLEGTTYRTWRNEDWKFGSPEESYPRYPFLRYAPGSDTALPACSGSGRPSCESVLPHQLDVDEDGDGLIELRYVDELNVMRYQMDGAGYRASSTAVLLSAGCPLVDGIEKCRGYEMVRTLDIGEASDTVAQVGRYYWRLENRKLWPRVFFPEESAVLGWPPIGSADNKFNAVFDGNSQRLFGLWVYNRTSAGFFGEIGEDAKISHMVFNRPIIIGSIEAGALAANNAGHISRVAAFDAYIRGNSHLGGLVGRNSGTISNSFVDRPEIICDGGQWFGGLVGRNDGGIIDYSFAYIQNLSFINTTPSTVITCSGKSQYVGGLVGGNTRGSLIAHSHASIPITAYSLIGGLTGINVDNSVIRDSYAIGNIRATGPIGDIGGLVGFNISNIQNSYATGKVSGNHPRGGLIGFEINKALVEDSYWDTELSGISDENDSRGKNSAELKTPTTATGIYRDWLISDWNFGSDRHYPAIRNSECAVEADPGSCTKLLGYQRMGLQEIAVDENRLVLPRIRSNVGNYSIVVGGTERRVEVTPFVENPETLSYMSIERNVVDNGQPYTIIRDINLLRMYHRDTTFLPYQRIRLFYNLDVVNIVPSFATPYHQLDDSYTISEGASGERLIGGYDIWATFPGEATMEIEDSSEDISYEWIDLSGINLLQDTIKTNATLQLPTIPTNLVQGPTAQYSYLDLVLKLKYRNIIATNKIQLEIEKVQNGVIFVGAPVQEGENYVVKLDLSEDPDGVSPNPSIRYSWQIYLPNTDFSFPIAGATSSTYSLRNVSPNRRYGVWIGYTDGQGFRNFVGSRPVTYRGPGADDASLRRLSLKAGTRLIDLQRISTDEDEEIIRYRAGVKRGEDVITLIAEAAHVGAELSIDGDNFTTGVREMEFDLRTGTRSITITVRAVDGSEQSSIIEIHRLNNNANLEDLSITPGNLDFERCNTDCTVSFGNSVISVLLTARVADQNATITINGIPVDIINREANTEITDLGAGQTTTVSVVVTSEDKEISRRYLLKIIRAEAQSDNADLAYIKLSPPSNLPFEFQPRLSHYEVSMPVETTILGIDAQAGESEATIAIDGNPPTVNTATVNVALADAGELKTVVILVTSPDQTTTRSYTLAVTREAGSEAALAKLELYESESEINLVKGFDSEQGSYIVRISTGNVVVKAEAAHKNAVITGTCGTCTPDTFGEGIGSLSQAVNLDGNQYINDIKIKSTSGDGFSTKSYTLLVTGPNRGADIAFLSDLDLSLSDANLQPNFESSVFNYSLHTSLDISDISLIATLSSTASASINITSSADPDFSLAAESGIRSAAIPLDTLSNTTITITVSTAIVSTAISVVYQINVVQDSDGDGIPNGMDVDDDNDGLIEVHSLEDLDRMRFQLDGSGYVIRAGEPKDTTGCATGSGCIGYELTKNLDFLDDSSYRDAITRRANKIAWTTGGGWLPLGTGAQPYTGIFNGNGYTISNLFIYNTSGFPIGFFSRTSGAIIDYVGLLNVKITGAWDTGGLVGRASDASIISNSFVTGDIATANRSAGGLVGSLEAMTSEKSEIKNSYVVAEIVSDTGLVGGLVGNMNGTTSIDDSYAISNLIGDRELGGLVGRGHGDAQINNSYAIPIVQGNTMLGGLIGNSNGTLLGNSYWDSTISGIAGGRMAVSTEALQMPTTAGSTATEIYYQWSTDNWSFGDAEQYPAVKYNNDLCDISIPTKWVRCDFEGESLSGQHLSLVDLQIIEHIDGEAFDSLLFPEQLSLFRDDYTLTVYDRTTTVTLIPTLSKTHSTATIVIGNDAGYESAVASGGRVSGVPVDNGAKIVVALHVDEKPFVSHGILINYYTDLTAIDIDSDDDGYIDIRSPDGLSALRYQTDGTGFREAADRSKSTRGCPDDICIGYELANDVDLSTYANWQPIANFNTVFNGNGYTISNLSINRSEQNDVALFASISEDSKINYVNLASVNVRGWNQVAGLVANGRGKINNSSVSGRIVGNAYIGGIAGILYRTGGLINSYATIELMGNNRVGGLIGSTDAPINNSYAIGTVTQRNDSSNRLGGLVGYLNLVTITDSYAAVDVTGHQRSGGIVGDLPLTEFDRVVNSYAIGRVQGSQRGGIIPYFVTANNSYWNRTINPDIPTNNSSGIAKTTAELKTGTAGSSAGDIYLNWSDADWDFGSAAQYPGIKYAIGDEADPACRATTDTTVILPICGTLLPGQLHRPPGSYLTALTIAPVKNFSPRFDTLNSAYRATVSNSTETVVITMQAAGLDASIKLNVNEDQYTADRTLSENISLREGFNSIVIEITAPGETTRTYTVMLLREIIPTLIDIELPLSESHLEPNFRQDIFNYKIRSLFDNRHIQLMPVPEHPDWVMIRITSSADADFSIISSSGTRTYTIPVDPSFNTTITIITTADATVGNASLRYLINIDKDFDDDGIYDNSDIDYDNDGLIEIHNLEDLHAIRYRLDGSAYVAGPGGSPDTSGCAVASGCIGYELIDDLDFLDHTSYRDTQNPANKNAWTGGQGWPPIGDETQPFTAIFNGNGYTISNLYVNDITALPAGLFSKVAGATIDNIGLLNVNVSGLWNVGGIAGHATSSSRISNSFVTGEVEVVNEGVGGLVGFLESQELQISGITNSYVFVNVRGGSDQAGGLVGIMNNYSQLSNSYAIATVSANREVGGLVGKADSNVNINDSYAVATVAGRSLIDGLVGNSNGASIGNSYSDSTVSGITDSSSSGASAVSTEALRMPTAAGSTSTEVYYQWSNNDWDFGNDEQYPAIKYDNDLCSTAISEKWIRCDMRGQLIDGQHLNLVSLEIQESIDGVEADAALYPRLHPMLEHDYKLTVYPQTTTLTLIPLLSHSYSTPTIIIGSDADPNYKKNINSGELISDLPVDNDKQITIDLAIDGKSYIAYRISVNRYTGLTAVDIDQDDDGYIDIRSAGALDAVRYAPDGSGFKESSDKNKSTRGCPDDICIGYELLGDVDLSSYANWQPISDFTSAFKGNNYTIYNLRIDRRNQSRVGLFGTISGRSTKIDYVNLSNVNIHGQDRVAGLAGVSNGEITNSSVSGHISGRFRIGGIVGNTNSGSSIINSHADVNVRGTAGVGALVGIGNGLITNSYGDGTVVGTNNVGGLAGQFGNNSIINSYSTADVNGDAGVGGISGVTSNGVAKIINTYAIGRIVGEDRGGIVATNIGSLTITNSYSNSDVNPDIPMSLGGEAKTGTELRAATAGSRAGDIYFEWQGTDWDFGTARQYPGIKYAIGDEADPACRVTTDTTVILPICGTLLPGQLHRPPSQYLSDLDIEPLQSLTPQFDSLVTEYSATVANSVKTITVAAYAGSNAMITMIANEQHYRAREHIARDISLKLGINTITIEVAVPGETTNTYTVIATREIDLRLANLEFSSDDWRLIPDFNSDIFDYILQIPVDTRYIQLTPTAKDPESVTMQINSSAIPNSVVDVSNGVQTNTIALSPLIDTLVRLTVTLDATISSASATYRINVSKDIDGDGINDDLDIDDDNDGLIEVHDLDALNEIRYQLDGSAYVQSSGGSRNITGCLAAGGCIGYELVRDLDFEDDDSYRDRQSPEPKMRWTTGAGWPPIGSETEPFTGTFSGNGYTISNLFINGTNITNAGLFAKIENSTIDYTSLLNLRITGWQYLGGLVGQATSASKITNSFITGTIKAGHGNSGGLVGVLEGQAGIISEIENSYALVHIDSGFNPAGGLVGIMKDYASITNSYAMASIEGTGDRGFLVGRGSSEATIDDSYAVAVLTNESAAAHGLISDLNGSVVNNSYWDSTIGGIESGEGDTNGVGLATVALQSPIKAGSTSNEVYYRWRSDNWDFGDTELYPAIKYHNDLCNTSTSTKWIPCDAQGQLLFGQHTVLSGIELVEQLNERVYNPSLLPEKFISTRQDYLLSLYEQTTMLGLTLVVSHGYATPDIVIGSSADASYRATINSGGSVSDIPVDGSGKTTVELRIDGRLFLEYRISVNRYGELTDVDIDRDDDGYIDIRSANALNAIRFQPDGIGFRENDGVSRSTSGCPENTCIGYELTTDIDLSAYSNWSPIENFNTILKGNNYTISNLHIDREPDKVGLFKSITAAAQIDHLNLSDVNVSGQGFVGALVAMNEGKITNSSVSGRVEGTFIVGGMVAHATTHSGIINSFVDCNVTGIESVGGLIGQNEGSVDNSYSVGTVVGRGLIKHTVGGLIGVLSSGSIRNSYAAAAVSSTEKAGGLVGSMPPGLSSIINSYAIGKISGGPIGGLVPVANVNVLNSYWDSSVNPGASTNFPGEAKTTGEMLRGREGTRASDIYYRWDDTDWNFGNSLQYPRLKYAIGDENDPACRTEMEATTVSPICGTLLPRQSHLNLSTYLYDLRLISVKTFSPEFESPKTEYQATVANSTKTITVITRPTPEATVKISANGIVLATGRSFLENIPLNVGANTIEIEVSAPGKRTHTYTVTVIREFDLSLESLILEAGEQRFVSTHEELMSDDIEQPSHRYTIPIRVEEIVIRALARDSSVRVLLNEDSAIGSEAIGIIDNLKRGMNTYEIKLIARDDMTSKVHSVLVERIGNDNRLTSLTLKPEAAVRIYTPSFEDDVYEYETTISKSVKTVRVKATVIDEDAEIEITVNDNEISHRRIANKEIESEAFAVISGTRNQVRIKVMSSDQSSQSYILLLSRAPNDNADLAVLNIVGAKLDRAFDAETTAYETGVTNNTAELEVIAEAEDDDATIEIEINGEPVEPGSRRVGLKAAGAEASTNNIVVVVTAENGTDKTYRIRVRRDARDSNNDDLNSVALYEHNSETPFEIVGLDDFDGDRNYQVSVSTDVKIIQMIPLAADSGASLQVDGASLVNRSIDIELAEEINVRRPVQITVIAENGVNSQSYTIFVIRTPSDDKSLKYLRLSEENGDPIPLTPDFATTRTRYELRVPNALGRLVITAQANQPRASIVADDNPDIVGGVMRRTVELGENKITFVDFKVVANDGSSATYIVSVFRPYSSDVALTKLTLFPLSENQEELVSDSGTMMSNIVFYQNTVESLRTRIETQHSSATIIISRRDDTEDPFNFLLGLAVDPDAEENDTEISEGELLSNPIELVPGEMTLMDIMVLAQDGVSSMTYTVSVLRALNVDANLSNLQITKAGIPISPLPLFSSEITTYTVSVSNDTEELRVTATASDTEHASIQISVDDGALEDLASKEVVVWPGRKTMRGFETVVRIKVIANDDQTSKSYTVTLIRLFDADDATLHNLEVSPGKLEPDYTTATFVYTVNVSNTTETIKVIPTTNNNGVTTITSVFMNSRTVYPPNTDIPLDVLGDTGNIIEVEVESEDGTNSNTYTIKVIRESLGIRIRAKVFLEGPLQ